MVKMNKFNLFFLALMVVGTVFSQSEGLTSSPYSLYGLGVVNQTGIGRTNGMGYSGIALREEGEINNLNAASFALMPENSFIYDVGLKGQYNTYSNRSDQENRTTLNFSNLAMAFRIFEGLGAGIAMVPYSDVGYSLVGIKSNIEGTNEVFESNVRGIGGLSDLRLNLGYRITDGLRFGLSTSLLFGNVEEEESFQISTSSFNLSEETNYTGLRLGTAMQFDLTDNITIGGTMQFPTSLKGNLKRSVLKNIDDTEIVVDSDDSDAIDDFKLPLEVGVGISVKTFNSLVLSFDYKNNFWSKTGQTENLGHYVDQSIFAFGAEYVSKQDSYKYADRIRYRMGYNYDTGYLSVNNSKIAGHALTAGIGLPIGQGHTSMLNLSYSYGSQGQIQNILVEENFQVLTLNLSLRDVWFQKRKIY